MVIQDEVCCLLVVTYAHCLCDVASPDAEEFLVAREGVRVFRVALEKQYRSIHVESDSIKLVQTALCLRVDYSPLSPVVVYIKVELRSLSRKKKRKVELRSSSLVPRIVTFTVLLILFSNLESFGLNNSRNCSRCYFLGLVTFYTLKVYSDF